VRLEGGGGTAQEPTDEAAEDVAAARPERGERTTAYGVANGSRHGDDQDADDLDVDVAREPRYIDWLGSFLGSVLHRDHAKRIDTPKSHL